MKNSVDIVKEQIQESGGLLGADPEKTQKALLDFSLGVSGDMAPPGSDLVIDKLTDKAKEKYVE